MIYLGRFAVVSVLFLILSFFCLSNTQAYTVDSPHNESIGIYCFMCHNNAAWYWSDPNNNTGDIDVTIRNTICLSCHDVNPAPSPWVIEAPVMSLHRPCPSGTWSTQCTDCHDPHAQPQMDWADSDPASRQQGDRTDRQWHIKCL